MKIEHLMLFIIELKNFPLIPPGKRRNMHLCLIHNRRVSPCDHSRKSRNHGRTAKTVELRPPTHTKKNLSKTLHPQ